MIYNKWVNKKPRFNAECIIICASKIRGTFEYILFELKLIETEDKIYLGWFTSDGDEYGDLEELKADKFLILKPLKKTIK